MRDMIKEMEALERAYREAEDKTEFLKGLLFFVYSEGCPTEERLDKALRKMRRGQEEMSRLVKAVSDELAPWLSLDHGGIDGDIVVRDEHLFKGLCNLFEADPSDAQDLRTRTIIRMLGTLQRREDSVALAKKELTVMERRQESLEAEINDKAVPPKKKTQPV